MMQVTPVMQVTPCYGKWEIILFFSFLAKTRSTGPVE